MFNVSTVTLQNQATGGMSIGSGGAGAAAQTSNGATFRVPGTPRTDGGPAKLLLPVDALLPPDLPSDRDRVLYPVGLDLNLATLQFHFMTWATASFETRDELARHVSELLIDNRLLFRSRPARTKFRTWWARYARRFVGDLSDSFLPTLRCGAVRGHYVRQPSALDRIGVLTSLPLDMWQLDNRKTARVGLLDILPAWAWIVSHCSKPVHLVQGGWLFRSDTDAAMFTLFEASQRPKLWNGADTDI